MGGPGPREPGWVGPLLLGEHWLPHRAGCSWSHPWVSERLKKYGSFPYPINGYDAINNRCHKPEWHLLFPHKESLPSFTLYHRLFKLAQLTSDLALAGKLTCPCYLLFFQILCSLQSSMAITLYVLLVH